MSRDTCSHCGADLPRKAKACPECGSDEKTGWSEQAHTSGLDLPDEDFSYEEFVKNEFGEGEKIKPRGLHWFWWLVAIGLLGVIVFWLFYKPV
jgi:hypothetical protein